MTSSARAFARGLHTFLTVLLIATTAWASLVVIGLLGLAIEPMHPMRRFLTVTTLYPLHASQGAIASLVTADAPPSSVEIELMAFVTFRPWTHGFLLATAVAAAVWWGIWIAALAQLRRIADTLRSGKPFQASNVPRIRLAGWAVIGVAVFEPLWEAASIAYMKSAFTLHGVGPFPPWPLVIESLPIGTLFAGVIVLAVAEVFRLGVALEDEQALTI
jgi:hypothetical protein